MSRWEGDAQSARDAATLLPVVAAVLLLPPFILVFAAPAHIAGIPLIVVYVFGVWAAVILCAFLVARRLKTPDGADGQPATEEPPAADGL
jgi:hypothetical protein